jgi:hypothetical protein
MNYQPGIDATMKASIHSEVKFFTNRGKSNPREQGNEKQSGWMVFLETLELIYMSPLRARQKTTPRCQSLITARSDHPPVLGHSGPQPAEFRRASHAPGQGSSGARPCAHLGPGGDGSWGGERAGVGARRGPAAAAAAARLWR